MIRWYGRKDLGTGILFNKTDGGDGFPGTVYTKERNQKISNSLFGREKSIDHKLALSESKIGKSQSLETIQNRVSKLKGKKRTKEFKEAQSERFAGKPKPWLVGREGANKGRKWWNNGTSSKLSSECPGNGWIEGRIL